MFISYRAEQSTKAGAELTEEDRKKELQEKNTLEEQLKIV